MFSQIKTWILGNPLDRILKPYTAHASPRVLIYWNRGLGDIPLGLYALCAHIRKVIPDAQVVFLTRADLALAFEMLDNIEVLVDENMKRGESPSVDRGLMQHGLKRENFDLIIEKVDSKRWLDWQLGTLTPKLTWNSDWDACAGAFGLEDTKSYLGVHVSSETAQYYGYEKNWSPEAFQKLFDLISKTSTQKIILFGMKPQHVFQGKNIIDLRGRTSLFEMLAIIKSHCSHLLAPDSGVLSIVYYINAQFPLNMVSLWADPRQGILKQKVDSPNLQLIHHPLVGKKECVAHISVDDVFKVLQR